MTRVLLCAVFISISLFVSGVNCEEDDSGKTLWDRLKDFWRRFREEVANMWSDFKQQFRAFAADMGDWSQEVRNEFEKKLTQFFRDNNVEESEQNEIRHYIERLQLEEEAAKKEE